MNSKRTLIVLLSLALLFMAVLPAINISAENAPVTPVTKEDLSCLFNTASYEHSRIVYLETPLYAAYLGYRINAAKAILEDDNASAEEIETAFLDLTNALEAFRKEDNTMALAEIDRLFPAEPYKYTAESWKNFVTCKGQLTAFHPFPNYIVLLENLEEAYQNLVAVDLKQLLLDELNKKPESGMLYTAASWSAYETIWNQAKALYDSETATDRQLYDVTDSLAEAFKHLEISIRSDLIAELENKPDNGQLYIPFLWQQYEAAWNHADTVSKDPSANEDVIQQALDQLKLSKEALILKSSVYLGGVTSNGAEKPVLADARVVLQAAVQKITLDSDMLTYLADVNGDNSISVEDARLILQLVVGKIDEF